MSYPKPIDCPCGNEISWASAISKTVLGKSEFYSVECSKCGIAGPVGRTPEEAAQKWNDYRQKQIELKAVAKISHNLPRTCLTCGRQTCDRQPEDNDPEDCKDWKPEDGEPESAVNPIREEYERSGFKGTYTEWLEKIAEELIPDCMKPWKKGL